MAKFYASWTCFCLAAIVVEIEAMLLIVVACVSLYCLHAIPNDRFVF